MRKISLYLMAAFYAAAGIAHFSNPSFFVSIFPEFLNLDDWNFPPVSRLGLTLISGACEIIFAALLLLPKTRKFAAFNIFLMLVVYLLLIHIPMVVDWAAINHPQLWVAIVRLPLQFVLLAWAWTFFKRPDLNLPKTPSAFPK